MAMSFALPAQAATYTAQRVKLTHDIGAGCNVAGINDAGQLSGGCFTADELFSVGSVTEAKGKKPTDFGLLGGIDSYGYDINNNGVVVGEATLPGDVIYHAVLRKPGDAGLTDLGTLGGSYAYAAGINDNGQIVGYSYTADDAQGQIFVASLADTRLVNLGAVNDVTSSTPVGINGKGVIAGYGYTAASPNYTHAFYAKPPKYKFIDLGTLGGAISLATAISDNGLVVGYSKIDSSSFRRAFIADINQGGVMKDLGTPAGLNTRAYGVNNHGQVVGSYLLADGVTYAPFMCSGDCSDFVDLNTVTGGLPEGVLLTSARIINKKGRIVAHGSDGYAYLLTPQQ
ncbi:hypothetical protein GCM10009107_13130 [Ideonella azotifigens]|uniref:HAF repeat-containing protein n=2 Tax=Ideonella azotifigens TaxID=513160 RepID=A0ABN1JT29_9BURK